MIVLCLLFGVEATAVAAPAGEYDGRTSQGRPITFTLAGGRIRNLQFQVAARCPSRHVWLVTARGFPPIRVRNGKFDESFKARSPSAAARVKGRVLRHQVTGSLTMRRYIRPEHHFCQGKARFSAHR